MASRNSKDTDVKPAVELRNDPAAAGEKLEVSLGPGADETTTSENVLRDLCGELGDLGKIRIRIVSAEEDEQHLVAKYEHLLQGIQPVSCSDACRKAIDGLSTGERMCFEGFLREAFEDDPLGHLIFFDKPAVLLSAKPMFPEQSEYGPYEPEWEKTKRTANETFQKHLANKSEIAFCLVDGRNAKGGCKPTCHLLVLHKDRALRVITENLDIFQNCYGEGNDAQQILDAICADARKLIPESAMGNHKPLGLILGFNRDDVLTFQRERELFAKSKTDASALAEFEQLRNARVDLSKIMMEIGEVCELERISKNAGPMQYVSWREPAQTAAECLKFARERFVISRHIKSADFFERCLNRIVSKS